MKTLFDEEPRYGITPTGTTWKLDGGKRYWRPGGGHTWYCDGDDLNLFQRWIDRGLLTEVSSAVYH